jgi:tRNA pseudouridine38-40 synthase
VETVRIRFDLSYDGTDFAGWARQRGDVRTVQGIFEAALTAVLRLPEQANLTVAGRTDAGVHASGQVAHLDVPERIWREHQERLLHRLAGKLPPDVRVWDAQPAPEGFDARFAAISRRYIYRVADCRFGTEPTRRRFVLWHPHRLDVEAMNEAAEFLLGEHDFAAYCKKREGATTIRRLLSLTWQRTEPHGGRDGAAGSKDEGDGAAGPEAEDPGIGAGSGEVNATVEADAFCHSMVRALVAAMLMVGDGRRPIEFPAEVLSSRIRHPGVNVAPPHGLSLEEVRYPQDTASMIARAAQARTKRSLPCRDPG